MTDPDIGGQTSGVDQDYYMQQNNQMYEGEVERRVEAREVLSQDLPLASQEGNRIVESAVRRVSNQMPIGSVQEQHGMGRVVRQAHLNRPPNLQQPPQQRIIPPSPPIQKLQFRQTMPAQPNNVHPFTPKAPNNSTMQFPIKPQSAQINSQNATMPEPISHTLVYGNNQQPVNRQNYHMGSLNNQRVVSNSSISAEMRMPHSGSPHVRAPYHSGLGQNQRSSVHSGSSNRRLNITFTYQGNFRHQHNSISPPHSQFKHLAPMPPRSTGEKPSPELVIWEKRFVHVSENFSYLYKEFRTFCHQYAVITKQLQRVEMNQQLEEVKEQYSDLLQKLSEKQQQMATLHEQYEQYLQICEDNEQLKKGGLEEKYKILEQDYETLSIEFQRFKQIFQRQKENEDELQHQLANMTQKYQELQEQYNSVANGAQSRNQLENYNLELQGYIEQLEKENQKLREEVKNRPTSNHSSDVEQKSKLIIENQQSIISNLETELKYLQEERNNLLKQIEQLQQNKEENEPLQFSSSSVSRQNNQILNNQQFMIKRLESQLQEATEEINKRNRDFEELQLNENQLRKVVESQQNIINNLEGQLSALSSKLEHSVQPQPISSSTELNSRRIIESQEQVIESLQEKVKELDQQLASKEHFTKREIQKVQALLTIRQQTLSSLQIQYEEAKQLSEGLKSALEEKDQEILVMKENFEEMKIEQQKKQVDEVRSNDGFRSGRGGLNNKAAISELEEEIDRLSTELRKKQQEKRIVEEKMMGVEETLQRTIMQKDSEIRLLKDQMKVREEQYERKLRDKERAIKNLEADANRIRPSQNLGESRGSIMAPSSPIHSHKNLQELEQYKSIISKNDIEIRELKRQRDERDKKLNSYQKTISQLQDQIMNKNKEISNMKRQLSGSMNFESEVKNLSETLAKKNQEVLELKSASYQKNQLLIEIQSLKNERNNLRETLKLRVKQIQKMRQMVSGYEDKMKDSARMFKSRDIDSDDFLLMEKSVRKKDTEISKLKQSVQLKDTNIEELQYEVEKLKGKINSAERLHQHQKEDAQEKIEYLENRVKQLEQKAKSLDETQKISKSKYEDEIQNLDVTIKEKEDIIRKLEGQLKVTKLKMKGHDGKVQQYDEKIEQLNQKIKSLEATNTDLQKHIDGFEQNEKTDKNKLYDQYQIKIAELEADVNIKDKKIKHLENNIQTLKLKMPEGTPNEEDFINQQQIEVLRKKVAEYESKLYAQNSKLNFKVRDFESGQLFQKKVIYQLKTQNERLKAILAAKGIGSDSFPLEFEQNKTFPENTPQVSFIQKRLFDFNKKLEEIIQTNHNLQIENDPSVQQRHSNHQIIKSFEKERKILIQKHRKEIISLQNRLVDLQKYCSTLEIQSNQTQFNSNTENKTNTMRAVFDKSAVSEQLNFYKEKNKELEERVDTHIKVNKELKDKLENIIKGGSDNNTSVYYKDQAIQLEAKLKDSAMKIEKLNEQIKFLRIDVNKSSSNDHLQTRFIELQNKNYELNRKISQLTMQNTTYTTEINRYQSELNRLEEENKKLKKQEKQKILKQGNQQLVLKQWKNKFSDLQLQIIKQNNKIEYQDAEIQNLQQQIKDREKEDTSEISKFRIKCNTLQDENKRLSEELEKYIHLDAVNIDKIDVLNNRVGILEEQISNLNSAKDTFIIKQKQTELSGYGLEQQITRLRNEITNLQIEKDKYEIVIDSLEEKVKELTAQNRYKQSEIDKFETILNTVKLDKESEGNQTKQRLAYIADMEDIIRKLRQEVQTQKRSHEITQDTLFQTSEEMTAIRSQIQYMHKDLESKMEHIEHLETQLHLHRQLYNRLKYQVEYARSCYIEIETLIGEMQIRTDERNNTIMEKARKQIMKGLGLCMEISMVIHE